MYFFLDYVNNPEYHKEMLEEAETLYNENKNLSYYTSDIVDKMKKLDNFIKESLRINENFGKKNNNSKLNYNITVYIFVGLITNLLFLYSNITS